MTDAERDAKPPQQGSAHARIGPITATANADVIAPRVGVAGGMGDGSLGDASVGETSIGGDGGKLSLEGGAADFRVESAVVVSAGVGGAGAISSNSSALNPTVIGEAPDKAAFTGKVRNPKKVRRIAKRIAAQPTAVQSSLNALIFDVAAEIERLEATTPNRDPEPHRAFIRFLRDLRVSLEAVQSEVSAALRATSTDAPFFAGKAAVVASSIEAAIVEDWKKNGSKYAHQVVSVGLLMTAVSVANLLGIGTEVVALLIAKFKYQRPPT